MDGLSHGNVATLGGVALPHGLTPTSHPPSCPGGEDAWISFADAPEVAQQPVPKAAESTSTKASVDVLKFDEDIGAQLTSQVQFPVDVEATKEPPVILPWRHWHQHNRNMGELEADKASAVAVLHGLHSMFDVTAQQVDVMQEGTRVFVVAVADIAENCVSLPPCLPRASKVFEKAGHPFAALSRFRSWIHTHINKGAQQILSETDFVLMPEFKAPLMHKVRAAVAESSAPSGSPQSRARQLRQGASQSRIRARRAETSSGSGAKAVQRQCIRSGARADSPRNNWTNLLRLASGGTKPQSRGGKRSFRASIANSRCIVNLR